MRTRYKVLFVCIALLLISAVTAYVYRSTVRETVSVATARLSSPADELFPDVQIDGLSDLQQNIIALGKAEYAKRPISFDVNVLKYSDGEKQAWCANFISWIMREAGKPLENPHSGSWRIPGVFTLQEYYQAAGRYQVVGEYLPKVGDVAIFIGRHTADLLSQQHASLVIAVDGDTMTTLGGNEGGRLRVSQQSIKQGENSLVGFGRLE